MIENDTWYRCNICGREGRVGRCCSDEDRTPLNDLARAEQEKERKMTVKKLIEKLKEFDENLPVYVNDNMGGGYPVSDMISEKEFTDGRKFVEIE